MHSIRAGRMGSTDERICCTQCQERERGRTARSDEGKATVKNRVWTDTKQNHLAFLTLCVCVCVCVCGCDDNDVERRFPEHLILHHGECARARKGRKQPLKRYAKPSKGSINLVSECMAKSETTTSETALRDNKRDADGTTTAEQVRGQRGSHLR